MQQALQCAGQATIESNFAFAVFRVTYSRPTLEEQIDTIRSI